ncbi:putative mannosylphosphate transferase [Rosellinia necatrix]|uniref:Putative mannosylphosphate transferase n=1 Tax=Rosellinia necatrix TaxID=77044 RepID=A0A1S7UKL4_ROSNE|nr:putative mannosylphosphate transferase [Rosellinia necatrix]
MRVLLPFLLFTLGTSAAPAIVTEVVTEIAWSAATPPPSKVVAAAAAAPIYEPNTQAERKEGGGRGGPKKPPAGSPRTTTTMTTTTTTGKGAKKGKEAGEKKYFHEPGWDAESGHYDARYFRGKVPYDQHRPALRHLVRSYLATSGALSVETWLAHGSLLGWWWNGRIMPWDYDLDVQVSIATLSFLAERYNRSLHEYEYDVDDDEAGGDRHSGQVPLLSPAVESRSGPGGDGTGSSSDRRGGSGGGGDGGGDGGSDSRSHDEKGGEGKGAEGTTETKIKKTYLLDVNPHYDALTKANGANVIDARWIDTSNGMFIDITGLRERDADSAPGVWSCKNNHRYRTGELWPLRRTEFEGAEAWIPYAFDKVLTDEYGPKSLVREEWAGHRWNPELMEWVKLPKKQETEPEQEQKPPQREVHRFKDEKGVENVVVYEDVIVEV